VDYVSGRIDVHGFRKGMKMRFALNSSDMYELYLVGRFIKP
jgi:hypothetical protein